MTELDAQIQVDHGLFLLKKVLEDLNTITPIDVAIDRACNRDRLRELRQDAIKVLTSMIEAKTFLGCDYEREQKMINQIKSLGGQSY